MRGRILIVDDDGAAKELDPALERAGLETLRVFAPRHLEQAVSRERPGAILVPALRRDAAQWVARIRALDGGRELPVLMYGYGAPQDPVSTPSDALEAGADYFFKLPTDMDYLAGRVAAWTESAPSLPPPSEVPTGAFTLEALDEPAARPGSDGLPLLGALRGEAPGDESWSWVQASPGPEAVPLPDPIPDADTNIDDGPPIPEARVHPERTDPNLRAPPISEGSTHDAIVVPDPAGAPPPRAPSTPDSSGQALLRDADLALAEDRPDDALEALETAAAIFRADDDPAAARSALGRALALAPTRIDLAQTAADLALEEGQLEEACRMLEACAEAWGPAYESRPLWERLSQLRPEVPRYTIAVEALGPEASAPTPDLEPEPEPALDSGSEADGADADPTVTADGQGFVAASDASDFSAGLYDDWAGADAEEDEAANVASTESPSDLLADGAAYHRSSAGKGDDERRQAEGEAEPFPEPVIEPFLSPLADAKAPKPAPDEVPPWDLEPDLSAEAQTPVPAPPEPPSSRGPRLFEDLEEAEAGTGAEPVELQPGAAPQEEDADPLAALAPAPAAPPAEAVGGVAEPEDEVFDPGAFAAFLEAQAEAAAQPAPPWRPSLGRPPEAEQTPSPGTTVEAAASAPTGPAAWSSPNSGVAGASVRADRLRADPVGGELGAKPEGSFEGSADPRAGVPSDPERDAQTGEPKEDERRASSVSPAWREEFRAALAGRAELPVPPSRPPRTATPSRRPGFRAWLEASHIPSLGRPSEAPSSGAAPKLGLATSAAPAGRASSPPASGPALDNAPEPTGRPAPRRAGSDAWGTLPPEGPAPPPRADSWTRGGAPGRAEVEEGELAGPVAAVRLLHRLHEAGASGLLQWNGETLVFVEGEPRAVRGHRALDDLEERFGTGTSRVPKDGPLRPELMAVARVLGMSPSALDLALSRSLEEAVGRFVAFRGRWRFAPEATRRDEWLPPLPLRERLADAVAGHVPFDRVWAEVAGSLQVDPRRPVPRRERDRRLLALLGTHPLDEARRLAGLSRERAGALALVWLGQGLALKAPSAGGTPASPGAAIEEESAPVPHDSLVPLPGPERLQRLLQLARTSDYFRLLDVGFEATAPQVDRAHAFVKSLLPEAHGGDADARREEVVEILDEARAVLRDPRLRDAYKAHVVPT